MNKYTIYEDSCMHVCYLNLAKRKALPLRDEDLERAFAFQPEANPFANLYAL